MISIVAKFTVKEGVEKTFLDIIDGLIKSSNAEDGCIEYILHKDVEKPLVYCLIEKWKNQEAVDFHNKTSHFTTIVPKLVELAKVEVDVYKPV